MNKIKQLILIAALLPASAMAHEWEAGYWLERMDRNHTKIGDCFQAAVVDGDTVTFRQSCSLHSMGYTENSVYAEYQAARLHHPLMSDAEFIANHFGDEYDFYEQAHIFKHIRMIKTAASAGIVTMHIVEGLTRNDK